MMKFSKRRRVARRPVSDMIEDLHYRLEGLQQNPVGVDRISERGYKRVIEELSSVEDRIDQADGNLNVIWTILSNNAQYFTAVEYSQLLDLSKKVVF